jgi:5-methylcytosine-specific restriction endonuclease McrA
MVDEQGVERGGGVMKVEGRREKGEGAYTLPDYSLIPVPADPPRIRDGRRKRKRFSAGGKFMAKYEAQQGICAICHEFFPPEKMTRDHIVPKSKGGGPDWDNLQLTCGPCNQRKADRVPEET